MLIDTRGYSTGGTATLLLLAALSTNVASGQKGFGPYASVPSLGVDQSPSASTGASATITRGIEELLGLTAKEALGKHGITRLEQFTRYEAGWDSPSSEPLSIKSVSSFARFLEESGLQPPGMSVFMSAQGNVVINWIEERCGLVELEFGADGLHYFIEASSDEGLFANDDIGRSQLRALLRPVASAASGHASRA